MTPTPASRRRLTEPAALLVAAVTIACLGLTSVPVRAAAGRTYFPQGYTSAHSYQPRRLLLSGDGTLLVRQAHWRGWNDQRAVGRGVALVNDCVPYCAAGTFHRHRVAIRLTRPRQWCDARFFSSFRLTGRFRFHTTARGIVCL